MRLETWHFWFVGRRELVTRALDRIPGPAQGSVHLDIGCGTGRLVRQLREQGRTAIGFDLVADRLRANHHPGDGPLVAGSTTSLPARSAIADTVTLLDVLEHVPDRRALGEAHRVLRAGGHVIATVPACPWLWSTRDEAAGHLRRYRRSGFVRLLRESGFEVERVNHYQFLLFPAVLLSRLLARLLPAVEGVEERPLPRFNRLLTRLTLLEVALSDRIRWPWGSSLVAVCRKPEGSS